MTVGMTEQRGRGAVGLLLVADDDPLVARALRRMVGGSMEVVAVETVAAGVAVATTLHPLHAALVDASFCAGRLDGLAIVEALLQRDPRGSVAVYTGLGPGSVHSHVAAWGVPVIVKPDPVAVAGFVARALAGPPIVHASQRRSVDDDIARIQRQRDVTLGPTEIQLLRDILATGSLDYVVRSRDTHPDTVRRQVKSLLAKLRTPDVAKLLHSILAPPTYEAGPQEPPAA